MPIISSGKFEVPQDSFDDIAVEKPAVVHRIDLKELMPDLFVGTGRMPRLLAEVWRFVMDGFMEKTPGAYTLRGGNVVELVFHGLPEGSTRAKADNIRGKIVEEFRRRRETPETPEETHKKPPRDLKALVGQMESSLGRLVREGLGDNPGDDMVRLWAVRAMHNMIHSNHKIPLLPEMIALVEQSDIAYVPFRDSETGAISGSYTVIRSPVVRESYNTGEIMRQDLAMLFSAAVQLYYLRNKGQEGVIMLPVRAGTLMDAALADLYRSFLPRLDPAVGGGIMLEVQDLPSQRVVPALSETINSLSNAVRCCVMETSVLVRKNRLAEFPLIHASGFSLAEEGVAPGDMAGQGRIYAIYYRNIGIKTYIKGVGSEDALGYAQETGFTYIAGTALGELQKSAYALQKGRIV